MFLVLVYPLFSVAAGRLPTPQVVGPLSPSVAGGCHTRCPSGTGSIWNRVHLEQVAAVETTLETIGLVSPQFSGPAEEACASKFVSL